MSEIYILDEMPILDSPPTAQEEVYLAIPSLKRYLFARENGITIYGADSHPSWTVSVHAYKGKTAFDHWINSLPIAFLPRLLALVLLKWLSTRRVTAHGWIGKAIVVSGQNRSEIHFLVYSDSLDISLDLHLNLNESSRESLERGLGFLEEIVPH
jgi:hypothetical protein